MVQAEASSNGFDRQWAATVGQQCSELVTTNCVTIPVACTASRVNRPPSFCTSELFNQQRRSTVFEAWPWLLCDELPPRAHRSGQCAVRVPPLSHLVRARLRSPLRWPKSVHALEQAHSGSTRVAAALLASASSSSRPASERRATHSAAVRGVGSRLRRQQRAVRCHPLAVRSAQQPSVQPALRSTGVQPLERQAAHMSAVRRTEHSNSNTRTARLNTGESKWTSRPSGVSSERLLKCTAAVSRLPVHTGRCCATDRCLRAWRHSPNAATSWRETYSRAHIKSRRARRTTC